MVGPSRCCAVAVWQKCLVVDTEDSVRQQMAFGIKLNINQKVGGSDLRGNLTCTASGKIASLLINQRP